MPNLYDSDSDSPEKCRERRRRRIELRRSKWERLQFTNPTTESNSCSVISRKRCFAEANENLGQNPMPVYGSLSVKGDDAIFVKSEFCRPEICGGQPLHFYAMYDGHTAMLCRDMMHLILAEELCGGGTDSSSSSSSTSSSHSSEQNCVNRNEEGEFQENLVRLAMENSFKKMDQVAMTMFVYEQTGFKWCCKLMDLIMAKTTALVAVLAVNHILIANSGASRAVLCRDGRPIPLSVEHQDQWRPEILIRERKTEDEFLILATEKIWAVIPDEMACRAVSGSLGDASPMRDGEGPFKTKSALAAAILCRLAVGRGSSVDNCSVVIIDLKNQRAEIK